MAKFRTKIAHKKGSEIEINGHVIPLNPIDSDPGICEFEVPEARDDVFARLLEITDGFELIDGEVSAQKSEDTGSTTETPQGTGDKTADSPSLVIESADGTKIDLYQADKATLVAIGKDLGLTIPGATGLEKVREKVIAAFKETAQV